MIKMICHENGEPSALTVPQLAQHLGIMLKFHQRVRTFMKSEEQR